MRGDGVQLETNERVGARRWCVSAIDIRDTVWASIVRDRLTQKHTHTILKAVVRHACLRGVRAETKTKRTERQKRCCNFAMRDPK